jgi:hypothetical protein
MMTSSRPAIVLLLLLQSACAPSKPSPGRVAEPLDPYAYRAHIALLDALLFENGPIGNEQQLVLVESVGRLAGAIALENDHRETAAELNRQLAGLVGTMQEATGKSMENSGIPEEWRRIRDTFFQNAAWFRTRSEDPVGRNYPPRREAGGQALAAVPEVDTLSAIYSSLMVMADLASRDLPAAQDADQQTRTVEVLNSGFATVDSMLDRPRDFGGDAHLESAWTSAREVSRLIKIFIASGADTLPGSPGRTALEDAVNQMSVGLDELERIGL